jgi:opacity protein-like surface antigen
MKKLLFLGACLVALASQPVVAQAGEPEVIVVQVYYTGIATGHILITRGAGKNEDIEFKGKSWTETGEAVQAAIAKLYKEGYSVKSTYAPGTGSAATLILVKGQ